MQTLRERLEGWVDIDDAALELAILFGLVTNDVDVFRAASRRVAAETEVGEALLGVIRVLIAGGILEADDDDEPSSVRWNAALDRFWEER